VSRTPDTVSDAVPDPVPRGDAGGRSARRIGRTMADGARMDGGADRFDPTAHGRFLPRETASQRLKTVSTAMPHPLGPANRNYR